MKKNHYEVLNLPKNCSAKEIKDSYIKLSKRYHPDLNNNNDKEAHKKFVEINEAYSILSKNHSRKCYDDMLSQKHDYRREGMSYTNPTRGRYETMYDYYHRQNMNAQYDFTSSSYSSHSTSAYKTKLTSVIFCCLLISFGTALQLSAIKRNVERRSYIAALHLQEARTRGEKHRKSGLPMEDLFKNQITQNGDSKN